MYMIRFFFIANYHFQRKTLDFWKNRIIYPVDLEERSCLKIIGCPNTRDKYWGHYQNFEKTFSFFRQTEII